MHDVLCSGGNARRMSVHTDRSPYSNASGLCANVIYSCRLHRWLPLAPKKRRTVGPDALDSLFGHGPMKSQNAVVFGTLPDYADLATLHGDVVTDDRIRYMIDFRNQSEGNNMKYHRNITLLGGDVVELWFLCPKGL